MRTNSDILKKIQYLIFFFLQSCLRNDGTDFKKIDWFKDYHTIILLKSILVKGDLLL